MPWKKHLNWYVPSLFNLNAPHIPWIALAVIIMVNICALGAGFSLMIVNSIVKTDLGIGAQENMWLNVSFFLLMAATAPIANWLADYYGRKRLFFIGTFIFFISAFFTGFAYSFPVMILCRGLSAIGAGTIIPLSIALIESVFQAKLTSVRHKEEVFQNTSLKRR